MKLKEQIVRDFILESDSIKWFGENWMVGKTYIELKVRGCIVKIRLDQEIPETNKQNLLLYFDSKLAKVDVVEITDF